MSGFGQKQPLQLSRTRSEHSHYQGSMTFLAGTLGCWEDLVGEGIYYDCLASRLQIKGSEFNR